jgi:hypothetical protein
MELMAVVESLERCGGVHVSGFRVGQGTEKVVFFSIFFFIIEI